MPPFSHTFTLQVPGRTPEDAYRIARDWLAGIGAKDLRETPPSALHAVFGTALTFGWKRKAKKILQLALQPTDGGTSVHLRIELTAAHADEVAVFGGKILASWQEFANELWRLYGGGTVASTPPVAAVMRPMAAGKRALYFAIGLAMLAGVPLSLVAGVRGFLAWTLGGALLGGGVILVIQGILGREQARSARSG